MHTKFLSNGTWCLFGIFSVQVHFLWFLAIFRHCWPFLFSRTPPVHSGRYIWPASCHLCDPLCVSYIDGDVLMHLWQHPSFIIPHQFCSLEFSLLWSVLQWNWWELSSRPSWLQTTAFSFHPLEERKP